MSTTGIPKRVSTTEAPWIRWLLTALALGFMVAAKGANVSVPLLLKELVDTMSFKPGDVQAVLVVPVALLGTLFIAALKAVAPVLVFIHDKPGALFDVLSPFARHGISMNRIESRPSHHGKWEYGFFIDLAGHIDDAPMQAALAELEAHSAQIKVLGSYPVAVP